MLNRRELLHALALSTAAATWPRLALAAADTDARFVLVILRGAVDGLALAAPYGDPDYRKTRGELALDAPGRTGGLLPLDGFFGLHPALETVHACYRAGNAAIVHAVAGPYRERSHFDGQDLLESGTAGVGERRDGWLYRALALLDGRIDAAIALAPHAPLVLRGAVPVASWAPSRLPDTDETTLARLQELYAGDRFFEPRLEQALKSQAIAGGMDGKQSRRGNEAQHFAAIMASAARFLVAPDGPRIAVTEFDGWDTHANQGAATGVLANRFAALDAGLAQLQRGLGDAWSRTVVTVVTEFGRTARVNGTRGTDHGTATAALVLGGAINGERVMADWPGLGRDDLFEDRDLRPTTDLRAVFKGVLEQHLGIDRDRIEHDVFPDSSGAGSMTQLVTG